jgi:hypothetical protein
MAKPGEQPFNEIVGQEKQNIGTGSDGAATQSLQADSNLADPKNQKTDFQVAQVREQVHIFDGEKYIKEKYGSDDNFLKAQPGELRKQLNMPATATSQQVYERMASQAQRLMITASPDYKAEMLKSLDLKQTDLNGKNPAAVHKTFLDAFRNREIRDSKLPANATYPELEAAMHRGSLAQIKSGRLPIDVD